MTNSITLLANAVTDITGPIQKQFHIEGNLFFSQLVSFIIVCFVLKKFAFGPLLAMLEQRKNRIAEGEEKLKRIEKQLSESEATTAAALEKANSDAKRLIEEAKESATLITEQKTQDAIVSAQNIISKAHEAAKSEQEQMVIELKRDFGRLVTLTTANVTGKILTEDDKGRINEEALSSIQG